MEYPKIHSLWKRKGWYFDEKDKKKTSPELQKDRQSFIIGDYAIEEFRSIKKWWVEEKVDGTNIRILYGKDESGKPTVVFKGRTSRAQIPCHLLEELQKIFTIDKMEVCFPEAKSVIIYGEGYGPKIQKCGSLYRDNPGFILFDSYVNGWWMERDSIYQIASDLGILHTPFIGILTEDAIVEYIKSKPLSKCSAQEQVMEGVICRTKPLLLLRNGKPLMFKLKCKEFNE